MEEFIVVNWVQVCHSFGAPESQLQMWVGGRCVQGVRVHRFKGLGLAFRVCEDARHWTSAEASGC